MTQKELSWPERAVITSPVTKLSAMFLEHPSPFAGGHAGESMVEVVYGVFSEGDDKLRKKIQAATRQAITFWSPDTSGLQNIESLAILSSFTENHAAVPELIRVVNEHRISRQDVASRLAEARVVGGIWGLIPDPVAVHAFESWWAGDPRDWMQTRAIFLGLLRADPSKLEELFPKFIAEATQHENIEDIPLLVDLMTESVHPDNLMRVFRQYLLAHPLDRIVDPAMAELEKLNSF